MSSEKIRRRQFPGIAVLEVELDGRVESVEIRGWLVPRARTPPTRETVVLIHGVGLSHRSFGMLARELSVHSEVIAVDMPGFGGLRRPKLALSVGELAEAVTQLMKHMSIESCVVVGHSMGAQVAVELGAANPTPVAAVVLIGPVVNPDRRTLFHQWVDLARDSAKEPATTNLMVFRDYAVCGIRWFTAEVAKMVQYSTEERIGRLDVPMLIIRGEHDPIATRKWCEQLAGRSRDGRVRTVLHHRHVVVHTAPAQVARLIETFEREIPL